MRWFFGSIIGFQIIVVVAVVSGVIYFGPMAFEGIMDRIDHAIDYTGSD